MVTGSPALFLRTLLLNGLTSHYANLWREFWSENFVHDQWAKTDPRLLANRFSALTPDWSLAHAPAH